jgi:hypothetical protein
MSLFGKRPKRKSKYTASIAGEYLRLKVKKAPAISLGFAPRGALESWGKTKSKKGFKMPSRGKGRLRL